MACIRHFYTCSFLVAVIAGSVIRFAEGRPLKALAKENHGKETIEAKPIPTGQQSDFPVTGPIPSYDVSGKKENFPPASPNGSSKLGASLTANSNDFRPTTPGNSPGVGHSHVGSKQDDMQHPARSSNPGVSQSLAAEREDFRPTGPGRSPGVGHSFQTKNREPNA